MNPTSKIEKTKIFYFFTILICLSNLENILSGARYLKYIIGPLAILLWAAQKFKLPRQRNGVGFVFIAYGAWLTASMLWGNLLLGGKDIFFILSYAVPIALFYSPKIKLDSIFFVYSTFFIISVPGSKFGSLSFADSTALIEGASSFVFGGFALAFLMRKKYFLMALSLILMIVTMKRISVIGFIICLAVWFSPSNVRNAISSRYSILALNLTVIVAIIAITTGFANEIVFDLTGKGTAEVTLGRTAHYLGVVTDIFANPQSLIFGNGAGAAYEKAIIDYENKASPLNLHSDTLKIFYESGIVCFLLFFLIVGKSKSIETRIMIIYISILFITDNVLVYTGVMFFITYIATHFEATYSKTTKLRTS